MLWLDVADSTAMTPTAISTHWLASLPPTRLSTQSVSEIKGSQRDGLLKMRAQLATFTTDRGKPYTLVELPLPRPMKDDNGDPLPATYCNYLVTPSAILMPTYNQSDLDAEAAQILERVYARQVIGIDCSVLVEQHGSLHCATMQIPRQLIKNISI